MPDEHNTQSGGENIMGEVAHLQTTAVARPLKVLVPLIKEDLSLGDQAAERAGLPFYRAAGEKLLEAKAQLDRGEWASWLKRNFDRSERQAQRYMQFANTTRDIENRRARPVTSIREAERQTNPNIGTGKTSWHEPVKEIINKVDIDTLNLHRDELKRAEERDAQRQLALQLIDIGYKALASKLHPDKGGSRDAMARLNQVRDRLKASA